MLFADPTQFAYAVARVRAVEKKMLDAAKQNRMLDAKTPEEALKVLIDADYGYSSADVTSPYQYEKLLLEERTKAFAFLDELYPNGEALLAFRIFYDYHNIKVILKSEFLGVEQNPQLLVETGSITPIRMIEHIKERNFEGIHEWMRDAVIESVDVYNRTKDTQLFEFILDKAAYAHAQQYVSLTKSSFLTEYFQLEIDERNFDAFFRARSLKKSWEFLQKSLLEGGKVSTKIFIEYLDARLESFVDALSNTPYQEAMQKALMDVETNGTPRVLVQYLEQLKGGLIQKTRYEILGVDPILAYWVMKESELFNVRRIMVGKINHVLNDTIKERLRDVYV